jgi:hypothetical protein
VFLALDAFIFICHVQPKNGCNIHVWHKLEPLPSSWLDSVVPFIRGGPLPSITSLKKSIEEYIQCIGEDGEWKNYLSKQRMKKLLAQHHMMEQQKGKRNKENFEIWDLKNGE